MSEIISAIFVSIAANMDNLLICLSYKRKLSFKENIIVSCVTVIMTSIALFFGSFLSNILTKNIATLISCLCLFIIGIYTLISTFRKPADNTTSKNLYLLAIMLSLNNLPTAALCTINGYSITIFILLFFICSMCFIYLSNLISEKLNSKYTNIIAGVLLIFAAIIRSMA